MDIDQLILELEAIRRWRPEIKYIELITGNGFRLEERKEKDGRVVVWIMEEYND